VKAHSSKDEFNGLLAIQGSELDRLLVTDGFQMMLDFYRHRRADDCPINSDGDMLLYQWGTHDWGNGAHFAIGLTRQFILSGDSEDEHIWQLSLTFHFTPSETLRAFGSGSKWCSSPDDQELAHFDGFIRGTAAFQEVSRSPASAVVLNYQCAG